IVPTAGFRHKESWEEDQYTIEYPFFHVLTSNYMTLHLRNKNCRDYIRSDNLAAAALERKKENEETDRGEEKKVIVRMITRREIDAAKERLIYGFFETYLELTEEEERKLMAEVEKLPEADEIMKLPISYEEKGIQKGKEIGKKEGEAQGVKKVAIEMLRNGLEVELIAKVTHMDVEEIKKIKEQL